MPTVQANTWASAGLLCRGGRLRDPLGKLLSDGFAVWAIGMLVGFPALLFGLKALTWILESLPK